MTTPQEHIEISFTEWFDNYIEENGVPDETVILGWFNREAYPLIVSHARSQALREAEEAVPRPFAIPVKVTDPDYGVELIRKVGFDDCRISTLAALRALHPRDTTSDA